MTADPSPTAGRDERLGEALAAWIEAAEAGQPPDSGKNGKNGGKMVKNGVSRHAAFTAPRDHENDLECGYSER
jgi:hypothetical protein